MHIIGIIPARLASTRFPGKPMAKICGIPMVGHVYFRSKMSKALDEVYIATCDNEIIEYSKSIGAKAIMTKDTHIGASDRTAEAMINSELETGKKVDIVVMIQGDEPMLNPQMIDLAICPMLADENLEVVNLMSCLRGAVEEEDPNIVKVVTDKRGYALYFSREALPSTKKTTRQVVRYKQVPIIPFKRDFLLTFNSLEQTPLEAIESVDMLRVLENGFKVKMVLSQYCTYGVDTPKDLKRVQKLMEKDDLFTYAS